jgi:hypothetical protein
MQNHPTERTRVNKKYLIIGLILIWLVVSLGTYSGWIHGADHRDFYPWWAGARRVLEGADDVYSLDAVRDIQLRLYGSILPENQDQQGFVYPAILLPILLPFGLINDVEIATALWEGFAVVLLIISIVALQKLTKEISLLPIVLFIFWFFTLLMIFQGQITGLVLASLSLGYYAYRRQRDWLAGILLSIGFVKPELVIVTVALMLIASLRQRRPKLLGGLVLGGLLLFLFSYILVGWWIPEWLEAVMRYTQYAQSVWPLGYLWQITPLLTAAVILLVLCVIYKNRSDGEGILAATVPIQLLFFPQTLIWGLTILIFPLTLAWNRAARAGVLIVWLLGWISAFGLGDPGWWKAQIILLSTAVLLLWLTISRGSAKRGSIDKASDGISSLE